MRGGKGDRAKLTILNHGHYAKNLPQFHSHIVVFLVEKRILN